MHQRIYFEAQLSESRYRLRLDLPGINLIEFPSCQLLNLVFGRLIGTIDDQLHVFVNTIIYIKSTDACTGIPIALPYTGRLFPLRYYSCVKHQVLMGRQTTVKHLRQIKSKGSFHLAMRRNVVVTDTLKIDCFFIKAYSPVHEIGDLRCRYPHDVIFGRYG